MTARVLDGRLIAAELIETLRQRAACLEAHGIIPHLAFVLIDGSPPAHMYARRLERLAHPAGILVTRRVLPPDVSVADLEREVAALNADDAVDGILVEMPLPDHLLPAQLSTIIDPRKDVDGITVENAGRLYLGLPGQVPSTASAMMHVLDWAGVDPLGQHVVVVGRSKVVGHPVAELLLERDATVTVAHRQTRDLAHVTRQADVLMVAAGEPHLIRADMVKPGAVIVDAGINSTPEGVVGDADFAAVAEVASMITPVPGGLGPVTNATLLRHVVDSAEQRDR